MPYGAVEWAREANKLQIKAGKPLTKEALSDKLGKPTGKVTRKSSLEKGGKWGPRTGDRKGQTSRRNSNLKRSSGELSPEDKRAKRNMEARHRRANKKITDPQKKLTVGHKEPAWKSGEQHKRLEETHGTEHADAILEKLRKSRQAVGGGLGDQKENLGTETEEENNTAREEYEQLEGALGQMEEANPSNPDNPSANYIEADAENGSSNGYENGSSNGYENGGSNGGHSNGSNGGYSNASIGGYLESIASSTALTGALVVTAVGIGFKLLNLPDPTKAFK